VASGAAGYAYTYDGDGNRVRKSNGNLAANGTLYWYMTPGIVGESDLSGNLTDEYVFFDGERVARKSTNGVFYYFSDHLKTASVITDAAGNIKSESDFYPWGGELQFVNNDSNHYKFTGKERDSETQLDYFGARYYSSGLGRFISSDWSPTPIPVPYADFHDPQSLNLYGYVRQTPTTRLDLDGHQEKERSPSGRVVTYTPDSAGRLVSAVDGNGTSYVTSASYNPDSSLKSLLNGSTPALNQNFQYTPRLQLCRITALTSGTLPTSCTDSQNIGNIMDRGYDFHAGNGTSGSGTDNGNVFAITNYRDTTRSQAFTYDALNRLTSGWSSANTGAYSWGENYAIDAWGNLQISPMGGKAHGGNFTLSGNAQNRPTGLAYDAAGNFTSYLSSTYTYDQENRLSSTSGMSYTYDGNGERVLKSNTSTGAAVKRYWSMGGNTLAEGDGAGNVTAEYIYFGSKRVARVDLPANTVHYYLSDHLGSASIVASAAAVVEEESDYSPFGTEVIVTGPGVNELKFTGKRRDTETGLDYFGARYLGSIMGRFMTPGLECQGRANSVRKIGQSPDFESVCICGEQSAEQNRP